MAKGRGIQRNLAAFEQPTKTCKQIHPPINSSMELTFLGNKYAKSEAISVRPTIQLKYMGKSYRAEQIKAVRNSVVLTYRGVSYAKS